MEKNQPRSLALNQLIVAKVFHLIRFTVFLASFVLLAQIGFGQDDPDIPATLRNKSNLSVEEFMRLRSEAIEGSKESSLCKSECQSKKYSLNIMDRNWA